MLIVKVSAELLEGLFKTGAKIDAARVVKGLPPKVELVKVCMDPSNVRIAELHFAEDSGAEEVKPCVIEFERIPEAAPVEVPPQEVVRKRKSKSA